MAGGQQSAQLLCRDPAISPQPVLAPSLLTVLTWSRSVHSGRDSLLSVEIRSD